MVRMGARASLAEDQRPIGRSSSLFVTVDAAGNVLGRREVVDDDGVVLRVTHFVDLDDGRRLTTEQLGEMSLSVRRACTLDELREEVRELIFEDEMREAVEWLSPWDDILQVLRGAHVAADEEALEALPFVVELDDEVCTLLTPSR
jgi:hypothetical protein